MWDAPKAVMMFAAGRGTRMAPLTDHLPKPLVQVAGRALIDHAFDLVADCEPVVVNTHYLASQVERHLAGHDVDIVHENELLETGGGLRNALPVLGTDPVITLNTDAVWRGGDVVNQLRTAWDPGRMDALLALIHPKNAFGHSGEGDFLLDIDGRLTRGPGLVYTGAQIVKTERLAEIQDEAFSMNVIWDMFACEDRLFGVEYTGAWCDVGQPESIRVAEAMLDV